MIADHCSHFTFDSIKILFEEEGYEILNSEEIINKEISLLVQLSDNNHEKRTKPTFFEIGKRISWLEKFTENAKSNSQRLIIFGSSISATWIASELDNDFEFYVDEDENRINKVHNGKNIKSLESLKEGDTLVLPFSDKTSSKLIEKLGNKFNYIFL